MRIIYNVKHRYAIRLKFEEKFLSSLTRLVLELKGSIYSTIKENLLLYCKFSAFCWSCHNLTYFYDKDYHKETPLVIETISFTTESLVFQNKHLNDVHSIPYKSALFR